MNRETAELISREIIREIQQDRTTNMLIQQIRGGNAPHITQEAWEIVAQYLEGGYPKKKGRPKDDLYYRNKFIADEYFKIKNRCKSKREAVDEIFRILRKKYGKDAIGPDTIQKIINKAEKERLEILNAQWGKEEET